jgi:hypothetical protein
MPLTHIASSLVAGDILRSKEVVAKMCPTFNEPLAYFFYGRPAYRVEDGDVVKLEAACPFCFVFDPNLALQASAIHAFDTGAFKSRLYEHVLTRDMNLEDFSLERDATRPNKLIAKVYSSRERYLKGGIENVGDPDSEAEPWDFGAKAYLHLLRSPGRNEPDDRIGSIEVVFGRPVPLAGWLKAVIVPHTLWKRKKWPVLTDLKQSGVEICPYSFVPGRHPEHYHSQLEGQVRKLYNRWKVLG